MGLTVDCLCLSLAFNAKDARKYIICLGKACLRLLTLGRVDDFNQAVLLGHLKISTAGEFVADACQRRIFLYGVTQEGVRIEQALQGLLPLVNPIA